MKNLKLDQTPIGFLADPFTPTGGGKGRVFLNRNWSAALMGSFVRWKECAAVSSSLSWPTITQELGENYALGGLLGLAYVLAELAYDEIDHESEKAEKAGAIEYEVFEWYPDIPCSFEPVSATSPVPALIKLPEALLDLRSPMALSHDQLFEILANASYPENLRAIVRKTLRDCGWPLKFDPLPEVGLTEDGLAEKYSVKYHTGGHPQFPAQAWYRAAESGDVRCSYWAWVKSQIAKEAAKEWSAN